VLRLNLSLHELSALMQKHDDFSAEAQQAAASGDALRAQQLQAQADAVAPAIGFLLLQSDGQLVGGAKELSTAGLLCASKFAMGTQEVSAEIALPAGGGYTIVACTFAPNHEAEFTLTLFSSDSSMEVRSLNGGRVADVTGALREKPGGAKPQGPKGPACRLAPPAAKHDVRQLRDEIGDNGRMNDSQRAELEEAARLETWVENVPMMTIEGQPLSENIKKRRDELVAFARTEAAKNGGLFVDHEFGGHQGEHQPSVYHRGLPVPGMPVVTHWRRPSEFCEKPTLFTNDWEAEGVMQGAVMDNRWLISAINIIAGNREQLDRVFMDKEHGDEGFYVCKIYHDDPFSDDDWQVILVDDRIPCDENGLPAFARNVNPNAFWVMIIEKAYAKFAKNYEAVQGGTVTQGLEDLTGGVPYKLDLEKDGEGGAKSWIPSKQGGGTPDRLWGVIMEKMMSNHVVGCASNTRGQPRTHTEEKGIVLNKAYSMVTGGEFECNKLMRLRIPLDENGEAREWSGKWSDESSAWNSRLRQMLAFSKKSDDGTFWIEYADFCKHFTKIYMCRMLDDLWTRFTVKARWMDATAGGCTNFISWRDNNQWLVTIRQPATKLLIKLVQPDARMSNGHGRHYSNAIGFYILKGNAEPADRKRRKLILKDGDEEDGGDFVFTKEPKFSRQARSLVPFPLVSSGDATTAAERAKCDTEGRGRILSRDKKVPVGLSSSNH